jgi:hypothetical protein
VHSAWRGQSFGGNFKAPNLAILKTARKSGDRKTVRSRTYWGEIQNFAGGEGDVDRAGGEDEVLKTDRTVVPQTTSNYPINYFCLNEPHPPASEFAKVRLAWMTFSTLILVHLTFVQVSPWQMNAKQPLRFKALGACMVTTPV